MNNDTAQIASLPAIYGAKQIAFTSTGRRLVNYNQIMHARQIIRDRAIEKLSNQAIAKQLDSGTLYI